MTDARMEIRRLKCRDLRYKRPILKDLSLDGIQSSLYEWQEACENVQWSLDGEGYDYLCEILGGEDEAQQFKLQYADLGASVERMQEDMNEEWMPELFDLIMVSSGIRGLGGGVLGYDEWEDDYFGLNSYETEFAEEIATDTVVKKLKKADLVDGFGRCFRVAMQWSSLKYRFDSLNAVMQIITEDTKAEMDATRDIDRLYDRISKVGWDHYSVREDVRLFDRITETLPAMAWLQ